MCFLKITIAGTYPSTFASLTKAILIPVDMPIGESVFLSIPNRKGPYKWHVDKVLFTEGEIPALQIELGDTFHINNAPLVLEAFQAFIDTLLERGWNIVNRSD